MSIFYLQKNWKINYSLKTILKEHAQNYYKSKRYEGNSKEKINQERSGLL